MSVNNRDVNRNLQGARLEISGAGFSTETATERSIGAVVLFGLSGVLFWWTFRYGANLDSVNGTSVQGISGFIAFFLLVIGFWLPFGQNKYIDLPQRRIVEEKWYSFLKCSRTETPIGSFSKVVVHHVCHPGGEGEDTFTGSVGLKPIEPGPILWVKEFPATKDEIPVEPDKFARELGRLTGLPYSLFPSETNQERE